MHPNQLFHKVFVINLDRRPDRLTQIASHLTALGIQFERVPAVDGDATELPAKWSYTPGAFGCLLSHLKCYQTISNQNIKGWTLILEDDAVFSPTFLTDLPFYWHTVYGFQELTPRLIYLGGNQLKYGAKPLVYQGVRVGLPLHYLTTHAYAITWDTAEALLGYRDLLKQPIDLTLCDFQKANFGRCFAPAKSLVTQLPGISDVCNQTFQDYTDCI